MNHLALKLKQLSKRVNSSYGVPVNGFAPPVCPTMLSWRPPATSGTPSSPHAHPHSRVPADPCSMSAPCSSGSGKPSSPRRALHARFSRSELTRSRTQRPAIRNNGLHRLRMVSREVITEWQAAIMTRRAWCEHYTRVEAASGLVPGSPTAAPRGSLHAGSHASATNQGLPNALVPPLYPLRLEVGQADASAAAPKDELFSKMVLDVRRFAAAQRRR